MLNVEDDVVLDPYHYNEIATISNKFLTGMGCCSINDVAPLLTFILSTDYKKEFSKQEPYIFFSYIEAPHPPFVFNKNGELLRLKNFSFFDGNDLINTYLKQDEYRKYYADEIQYLNKNIKKIVENLINSDNPPIIIIMSDHGGRSITDMNNSFFVKEKLGNFIAIRYPDKNANDYFYHTISNANILKIVFNNYFNTNLKLDTDQGVCFFSNFTNSDFSNSRILTE